MASAEMTMIYCYDVSDDRARRRIAAILEARCVRVQHSVFEARMQEGEAEQLFRRASEELAPGDSLRMYALSAWGLQRSRTAGGAPLPEDREFWLL